MLASGRRVVLLRDLGPTGGWAGKFWGKGRSGDKEQCDQVEVVRGVSKIRNPMSLAERSVAKIMPWGSPYRQRREDG